MNKVGSSESRTSRLNAPIDYNNLKIELEQALKADQLYRLQNDAKLRAIEQNVPTYDDFRQMVNAAHLRPLQPDERLLPRTNGSWNPIVTGRRRSTFQTEYVVFRNERTETRKRNDLVTDKSAVTCEQFTRDWKTIKECQAKFRYLETFKDLLESKIFRTEIPLTLFPELIEVCFETVATTNGNVESVVEILCVLCKCNRFSLTISFMGEKERTVCCQLFRRLIDHAKRRTSQRLEDVIESLKLTYEVTTD